MREPKVTGKPNASVWGASNEHWDNLLNDPDFASEIDTVKKQTVVNGSDNAVDTSRIDVEQIVADDSVEDDLVKERLLAYQTPITDEILRQSID
ncbi:MAG: hypothetical protein AB8B63_20200 [Granulosicoccus sp.]